VTDEHGVPRATKSRSVGAGRRPGAPLRPGDRVRRPGLAAASTVTCTTEYREFTGVRVRRDPATRILGRAASHLRRLRRSDGRSAPGTPRRLTSVNCSAPRPKHIARQMQFPGVLEDSARRQVSWALTTEPAAEWRRRRRHRGACAGHARLSHAPQLRRFLILGSAARTTRSSG